jgi:SAM-dependent methyltransferase
VHPADFETGKRAMNGKERRSALPPGPTSARGGNFAELLAAAVALHQAGALAEAERRYRQIVAQFPAHAETYSRLGAVLMAQGNAGEAVALIERALALKPDMFEAYGNLAQAYMAGGRLEPAVRVLARALEIRETPQGRALFADWIKPIRFRGDVDASVRRLVLRALVEGWAQPRELTAACISLLKCGGILNDCVRRADAAWPARLPATELFGASGLAALSADELLCRLLECDPITDVGLERFLTNVRSAMLTTANGEDQIVSRRELEFYSAVARQCFINEYVYALAETEEVRARELQSALVHRIEAGEPVPPLWPIAVGAYFPLFSLPHMDRLCDQSWPQYVEALLIQQIKEPAEERRIAASIPVLTGIDDEVSRAVRQQYEESPYPRWVRGRAPASPAGRNADPSERCPDVLIAGCGTGLSASEFARQMPAARILAIDLSLASLGYAKRMAQKFDLAHIEFAQADILNLGSIERQFDFIDTSGVLHHLADPWQGWRVLLSLLRPGGTMQVGLYSGLGRRNVVAARALIAERSYRPIAQDIRRCRQDIIAAADPLLRSLVDRHDFYTASECRDLLFHVQEHRITLPEIKSFLTANNMNFAGFMLDRPILQKFAARFPERAALTDLDRWHEFETALPDTFAGMYRFQVRKSPAAA